MKKLVVLVWAMVVLLGACGTVEKGIEIHTPWARPAAQGDNEAVYFELHNHGSTTDELTSASCDIAEATEIHESKMNGDVMEMNKMDSLPIDAYDEIQFAPGGYHIMLVGLKQEVKVGDEITVVLHFKNS